MSEFKNMKQYMKMQEEEARTQRLEEHIKNTQKEALGMSRDTQDNISNIAAAILDIEKIKGIDDVGDIIEIVSIIPDFYRELTEYFRNNTLQGYEIQEFFLEKSDTRDQYILVVVSPDLDDMFKNTYLTSLTEKLNKISEVYGIELLLDDSLRRK